MTDDLSIQRREGGRVPLILHFQRIIHVLFLNVKTAAHDTGETVQHRNRAADLPALAGNLDRAVPRDNCNMQIVLNLPDIPVVIAENLPLNICRIIQCYCHKSFTLCSLNSCQFPLLLPYRHPSQELPSRHRSRHHRLQKRRLLSFPRCRPVQ